MAISDYTYTFTSNPNTTYVGGATTFTTTTFTSTTSGGWSRNDPFVTGERNLELSKQWETPDHCFNGDEMACADCPSYSMYRYDPSFHAPMITEEPEACDVRDWLAS